MDFSNDISSGFGPFRNFTVNPSSVVVDDLKKLGQKDINLITHTIDVDYGVVKDTVPELWKRYKPQVMIHCGASNQATTLVLETQAHNGMYTSPDVHEQLPPNNYCCPPKEGVNHCLHPSFDIDAVCKEVNCSGLPIACAVSRDAGKYLCEFIFYQSLSISPWTAFVHVPPLDKPYSSLQLAQGLLCVIKALLSQRQADEKCTPCILLEQAG